MTSNPFVSRTLATLRKAELGFLGVRVITCKQTPRRCGQFLSAGDLDLSALERRPNRTSWLMVGMASLEILLARSAATREDATPWVLRDLSGAATDRKTRRSGP